VGLLKLLAAEVDGRYLDRWAATLGVSDLLARARTDASPAT
jgi:hypothetical protein